MPPCPPKRLTCVVRSSSLLPDQRLVAVRYCHACCACLPVGSPPPPVPALAGPPLSMSQKPFDMDSKIRRVLRTLAPTRQPSSLSAGLPAHSTPISADPVCVCSLALPPTVLALPSLHLSSHPHSRFGSFTAGSGFGCFACPRVAPAVVVLASRVARALVLFAFSSEARAFAVPVWLRF